MSRIFYGSVLAGVLLAFLAASVYPLPRNERYRSASSVIADGGRAETFVIQWPEDRVPMAAGAGLRRAGAALVLMSGEGIGASAEVFRLRDMAGNVIGLASRSTSARLQAGTAVQGSDWILLLPSRGTLFLTQVNAMDVAPRAGGLQDGLVAAADDPGFWTAGQRVRVNDGPLAGGRGEISGGTKEFARLKGSFEEVWELEEIGPNGVTRGRITLATRLQAGAQ